MVSILIYTLWVIHYNSILTVYQYGYTDMYQLVAILTSKNSTFPLSIFFSRYVCVRNPYLTRLNKKIHTFSLKNWMTDWLPTQLLPDKSLEKSVEASPCSFPSILFHAWLHVLALAQGEKIKWFEWLVSLEAQKYTQCILLYQIVIQFNSSLNGANEIIDSVWLICHRPLVNINRHGFFPLPYPMRCHLTPIA